MTLSHYFVPAHMTRTSSGNVGPCCARPADAHPAFVDGEAVTIELTRKLRGLKGSILPKGTRLAATREAYEGFAYVKQSRWGTNELGQFAELEKAELVKVTMPGYLVVVDTYNTGLPASSCREVVGR